MARDTIICGLDIGSSVIRTVIAQKRKGANSLAIIGLGEAPSAGVRKGVLVDIEEALVPIKASIKMAEQSCGYTIRSAYISLSGVHISARYSRGIISVSRADQEISDGDIARVVAQAQSISVPQNKEILHVLPKEFAVDGETGVRDPLGMRGLRLETNALIVEGSTPIIRNLAKCIETLDIDIDGFVLATIASSRAVLSRRQMELGVLALDIGGWTSGVSAYEEGNIIHTAILPVGAAHITNDIAIGLQVDVDVAEAIKLKYGVCRPDAVNKKELVSVSGRGSSDVIEHISRKEIAEVIEARTDELFDLVEKELKKISKQALFPAGVVLTGGGARMGGLVDFTKQRLKLPAHVGFPSHVDGIVDQIANPEYATGVGLCLLGNDVLDGKAPSGLFPLVELGSGSTGWLRRWVKTFLP